VAVKIRKCGVFGGKFSNAPMQEEDRRVRSQLSLIAWPLLLSGERFGFFFARSCDPIFILLNVARGGRGLSGTAATVLVGSARPGLAYDAKTPRYPCTLFVLVRSTTLRLSLQKFSPPTQE
jgi:hypothetical protein